MSKTAAMVSMKGHSSRVPRKNLRELAGRPLFYWIIKTLTDVPEIDEVIVETDSDEIADKVRAFFDVTLLRRPPELVGDDVPMNELIAFNMSQVPADTYLQTHCTNPLLKSATVSAALAALKANSGADSLFGVTEWKTRLFKADGSPLNHNPDELIPTQNLPPVYEENSNLYIFTADSFAKRRHRIGTAPMMFPIARLEAVDIDEMSDFEFADFLMRKRLKEGA
jgi:N-acylneuraminate cytidylyltransferase